MLRNTSELMHYALRAKDGYPGSIEDFYFDDEAWTIRYVVAATGTWLEGRSVLISPISLGPIDDGEKSLEVKLTKNQIENSPPIDTHKREVIMVLHNPKGAPEVQTVEGRE